MRYRFLDDVGHLYNLQKGLLQSINPVPFITIALANKFKIIYLLAVPY